MLTLEGFVKIAIWGGLNAVLIYLEFFFGFREWDF